MAFEPSSAEAANMKTVGDVYTWACIDGTLSEAVLAQLGVQLAHPVRTLAAIEEEEDITTAKATIRVDGNPLAPAAKGMLGSAWRAARVVARMAK